MTKYIININLPKESAEVEINVTFQDDKDTELAKELHDATTPLKTAVEQNT